jgi:replicative DNA helicase
LSEEARAFYTTIKNLYTGGITVNKRNVLTEINNHIEISESKVDAVFNIDVDEGDFNGLYNSLKKQWAKNDIQEYLLEDLLSDVSKKGDIDIDKLIETRSLLDERIRTIDESSLSIYTLKDMFNEYNKELNNRESGKSFYDTGCSHLNKYLTNGFAPQMITNIFGQSGVGKSTYALYLVNKQINKMIPSIYFSPEMPLISTMDRLVAQRIRVPIDNLYPSEDDEVGIGENVRAKIKKEMIKLIDNPYFRFVEEESLWLADVEAIIEKTKREMNTDYLIVTIDLLTMIKDFNLGSSDTKANKYENAMNLLHEIARRQNVHIVGIVQSRRPSGKVVINNVEDLERLRPGIEEIKNSGGIEERSRIVLSTFRKKFFAQKYLPDDPQTELMDDIMDVQVLKQNMGSLPVIHYLFDGPTSYICKYEEDEI